jgi:hypothetical protein
MRWLFDLRALSRGLAARGIPRTIADAPEATVVADTVVGDRRRLTVRFRAPYGTLSYAINGAEYVRAPRSMDACSTPRAIATCPRPCRAIHRAAGLIRRC